MFELDLKAGQSGSAFDHVCLPDTLDARVRLAAMSTLASTLAHEVNQPLSVADQLHQCVRQPAQDAWRLL